MSFLETVEKARAFLERNGRVSLSALRLEFGLDEAQIEALVDELVDVQQVAAREGKILAWLGIRAAERNVAAAEATRSADTAAQETATPDSAAGERRQLTVMFCDLVGSTELSRRLDAEDLRNVVRAYQESASQVIERYEGHVAQYLGDGLLVYFGHPQAHEDDAERAVRAALGILGAIAEPNAAIEKQHGLRLAVRIGIHTGPVVVGEMGGGEKKETLALGDTPNVAARLEGIAEPDTVVISDATLRLVAGLFVTEDRGTPELKGISEPIRVYRVVQPSGVTSRLDRAPRLTPFVGREEELGLLVDRFEQAQEKQGQAVWIAGEAGIGKSRLVHQLREGLRETPHSWLECQSSPYTQNSALYPVIELVEQGLRLSDVDAPEEKLGRLERGLELAGFELAEAVPLFAALLSLRLTERYAPLEISPALQRQRTLEVLLSWVLTLGEKQPVVLLLEDLHWADPTTLEWLGLLIEQCPTAGILILLTFRPDFEAPWPTRAYLLPIMLNRLNRRQARNLVAGAIPGGALPDELLDQLAARADGVPLFAEELSKNIVDSNRLVEREGQLELEGSPSELEIPATLQDSLMARLDQLGGAKRVAQLGAALGREFSYALLEAVAPLDATPLREGLGRLVKAELLYQRGLPPKATYTFKHALVQDTAYQSLLKSQREELHGRIAQTLEERFPERAAVEPEVLARHYQEAGLSEPAIAWFERAGRRATERFANAEAVEHLSRGVNLLLSLPEGRERDRREFALRIALGAPLASARGLGTPEVEENYARALSLARRVGDATERFQALAGLGVYYRNHDASRAIEVGEELLSLAEEMRETGPLLVAHSTLANPLCFRGPLSRAVEHHERAVALYDPSRHRSLVQVYGIDPGLSSLAMVCFPLWMLGYPDRALARVDRAVELANQGSHPLPKTLARGWAGMLHVVRREPQLVLEAFENRSEAADEPRLFLVAQFSFIVAWALSHGEDSESARREIESVRKGVIRERQRPPIQAFFWGAFADALLRLDRPGEAMESVNTGLAVADGAHAPFWDAELYRLTGEIRLAEEAPDEEEAEGSFRKAIEIAVDLEARSLELRAAMSLARLWQRQGKKDEARDLLAPVYDWFTEGFDTQDLKDAKALLSELSS